MLLARFARSGVINYAAVTTDSSAYFSSGITYAPNGANLAGILSERTARGLDESSPYVAVQMQGNPGREPMSERYDAIVVGLGGMGSAALAHLASRGRRVLGLEQYHPAHALGSSHGGSRIIRKAYYEDPAYVPLVLRAYELWQRLEEQTGARLLLRTGGLMAGYEGCEILEGSLRSARAHGLEYEVMSAADMRRRFPVLRPRPDEAALYEPDAGILFPEQCVLAHLQAAVAAGAEARFGLRVSSWKVEAGGASVTAGGDKILCDRLLLCAGPWLGQVAAGMTLPLQAERNIVHWFDPISDGSALGPSELPVYVLERRGIPIFYGIPLLPDQGIKAAFHYSQQTTTPDEVNRDVSGPEVAAMREALSAWMPDAAGAWRRSSVCMYTNTPDKHFLIGIYARYPQVIIAGGFSGHGFKFCPVIGEILADLALDGSTAHQIDLFAPERVW